MVSWLRASRRSRSPLFGLLALGLFVMGCSPEAAGVTGVGVDRSGDLVGYIQMCDGYVDSAVLYETDGDTLGIWNAPGRVPGFASWPLDRSGEWTQSRSYQPPIEGREYSLYGGTSDDSYSSRHVTFGLEELSDLRPGEVLYGDEGNGFERSAVAEFRREACDGI